MYASALAALAKLGFRLKSHAATIAVLERDYARAIPFLGPHAEYVRPFFSVGRLKSSLVFRESIKTHNRWGV
jgi:hypothetical protein